MCQTHGGLGVCHKGSRPSAFSLSGFGDRWNWGHWGWVGGVTERGHSRGRALREERLGGGPDQQCVLEQGLPVYALEVPKFLLFSEAQPTAPSKGQCGGDQH